MPAWRRAEYEQRQRAESADETRRRILDAVVSGCGEAPSQAVSIDQVARIAGVARSTVYLIFGSRAGLFDAVARDLLDRSGFERVVRAVADPDARATLRRGIRGGAHDVRGRPRRVPRALLDGAARPRRRRGRHPARRAAPGRRHGRSRPAARRAGRAPPGRHRRGRRRPALGADQLRQLRLLLTGRGLSAEAAAES